LKTGIEIPLELKKILQDNLSGSNLLRKKIILLFIKDFKGNLKFIPYLKKELNTFGSITALLKRLEKQTTVKTAIEYLHGELDKEESAYVKIYKKLYPYIKNHKRILTFSNSRTVYSILTQFKRDNNRLTVIISESRPMNEGRILASALAKGKIKIEFITEAMLPGYIDKCDSVILSADQILKNGDAINKTGSRLIAILCKEFKKPLYIIADKSKRTVKNTFIRENKPAKEVWDTNSPLIKVNNFYFERIEKKYITKVITN
jgi:translation initiation factor 2B subunit (eIF-2B alpha/beta/delta family)